jgi:beta-glucosidase
MFHILIFFFNFNKLSIEGKLNGGINQEGIKYYNNLINELLANG